MRARSVGTIATLTALSVAAAPRSVDRRAATDAATPTPSPRWTIAVLVLGAALAGQRAFPRIADPTLWGEDGAVFLKGVREDGLSSVIHTYAGYLHVIPRVIGLLLAPLPLTWQPGLYAAAGTAVGFGFAAMMLTSRIGWLLPRWPQRALLFIALVIAPARNEVTGNVANLIFVGSLGMLAIALCDDPRSRWGRWLEIAGMVLLGLSGPLGLVVVPMLAARAVRRRSAHSIALLLSAATCAIVQWTLLLSDPRLSLRSGSVHNAVTYARHRLFASWLVGDYGVTPAWQSHRTELVIGCVALVALLAGALAIEFDRVTALALVATMALACVIPALAYRRLASPPVAQRHLLLPLAVISMIVVVTLGGRWITLRVAAAVMLALSLVGVGTDFRLTPWPELPIGPTAACLAQHRAPCLLPVDPIGWQKVYLNR